MGKTALLSDDHISLRGAGKNTQHEAVSGCD
jgi:hypothetical protein